MFSWNYIFPFFSFLFCLSSVRAESIFLKGEKSKNLTLSGYIRDVKTGESLTGAIIYQKEKSEVAQNGLSGT